MRLFSKTLLVFFCAIFAQNVRADVKPATIFNDNMVLQRDRAIPVWGTALPGEDVEVMFAGQTKKTSAGTDGKWEVRLDPLKLNKNASEMTVKGKNNVVFKNVVVGDVWLCSGQSNMEWTVAASMDPAKFSQEADQFPLIRRIKIQHVTAEKPLDNAACSGWNVCSPKTVGAFTAVGYFFARKLYQELEIPIGLIDDSWSGCRIEPFMAPSGFKQEELKDFSNRLEALNLETEAGQKRYGAALQQCKKWLENAEKALQNKKIPDPMPQMPGLRDVGNATAQYNAMIAPIVRFPIKGALWYQGCSNGGEGDSYYFKMKGLVEGWRKDWGYDFPFYFVQLAAFTKATDDPAGGNGYAKIREAQRRSMTLPQTGMAVTIDIGDQQDIHPKNKIDVGERLALWALAKDYGKIDTVFSGPLFKSMKSENGKLRLEFDYADGLMTAKKTAYAKPVPVPGAKPAHFAIAGADKVWGWADAEIDGNSIILSSPAVKEPVAVRYAFRAYPSEVNLYNGAGLPMVPFRTDNW